MARPKTLGSQLLAKAQQLRTTQGEKAESAAALITASETAAKESATAGKHAAAVEEAFKTLEAAGVTL